MNHKKHMVEANVVYAFFMISHKPQKPMYAGFTCPHVCVIQHNERIKIVFMCFSGPLDRTAPSLHSKPDSSNMMALPSHLL
jgi:hypothetical protein